MGLSNYTQKYYIFLNITNKFIYQLIKERYGLSAVAWWKPSNWKFTRIITNS